MGTAKSAGRDRYGALFERRGARALALACTLGWLSYASYALAVVLAVHAASGSFAVAGAAIAALSAGSGLFAPLRGRYVDRRGPRALVFFAPVHTAALALLVLGCVARSDAWALIASAGMVGISAPPLIATARAAWSRISGPELAPAAHAVNAALGDAAALVGPALVGAIAGLLSPVVALALLIPGAAIGAVIVALDAPPSAAPRAAARPAAHRVWGVLRESAGLRTIVACELALGLCLGALEVTVPAIAAEAGSAALAALPLALFAGGSITVSVWSGSGRHAHSARWRFLAGSAAVAAVLPLSLIAQSLTGITAVLILAGGAFGLLNVALFELLDHLVAADRAVEAWTWLTLWQGVGLSLGAAAAGQLARHGASASLPLLAIPAVVAAAVAVARRSTLERGETAETEAEPTAAALAATSP